MTPNPQLFKRQYIGHARHEGPYPENSIPLYRYLVKGVGYKIIEADIVFTKDDVPVLNHSTNATLYRNGTLYNIYISEHTFNELSTYSLSKEDNILINKAEDFVRFGKENNVVIMFDMTFQKYSFKHYKILYSIVRRYNMQPNTIWADPSILKLAILNPRLICQFSGSWGRKLLITTFLRSLLCHTTIMSFSYYGGDINNFSSIPKYGHLLGFVMKVATVNDTTIAQQFWNIGTDLINTDKLLNSDIQ